MKTFTFNIQNNLSALHDELLAAIPALRPIPIGPDDNEPVMRIEGKNEGDNAGWVRLTVPDAIKKTDLQPVIQAHDPNKPRPDPRRDRRDRMTDLIALGKTNWTTAQLRELIDLAAQEALE